MLYDRQGRFIERLELQAGVVDLGHLDSGVYYLYNEKHSQVIKAVKI